MKKYFVLFILFYIAFIPSAGATVITTTGFIPGQIWYSKDTIAEGDTVKIYTAIWNNSTSPLSAKVEFYDQNVILGTRDVVLPSQQLMDASVTWKVTAGDHSISAKIISPSVTVSGKKEIVTVNNVLTSVDRKFVPVVLNTIEGQPATSTDILKSQIDKATASIDGIIPNSISEPVSKNVNSIDSFRIDTLASIANTKSEAEKTITELNKSDSNNKSASAGGKVLAVKNVAEKGKSIDSATEKPIAYIKLFLFSVLSFIFSSKIVFYFLIILIMFFIIRGIYRKVKNR
ncbi:MAG: hypothetical protein WCI91_00965 [Candidatus Nomurabacteria bacterium]